MKRKTVAVIVALILAVSLSACGNNKPTSNNNSDAERIAELEQELEELKAENKELKEQLENQGSTDSGQQATNEAEGLLKTTIESPETSGVCGANLTWYYQNGVLVITGTGEMSNYGWSNKSETSIDYKPNNPWYELHDKISWVIMDEGVTSVGDAAFAECSTISKVIIPNTVTSIGDRAFFGIWNLESIVYDGQTYTYEGFEEMLSDF